MHVVIKKILKISALTFVAVFLLQIFSSTSVDAATRTWTGTTSGSWSVASNWGGTAPVTGDDLVFPSGASNLSNTNDLTENTIINSISFTGSGYTLSGNPIILGPGLAGITDSVSSGGNTIALDIRLDVTRDIVVTNTAETLTISGRIAGVGGINKEGTGKVILSGANTFGGILKINVGVVNAQNNTALGTIAAGTEVVGGAALELQGTIDISYEALALRGYGVSNGGALRNISDTNIFRGLITLSSAAGAEIQSDSGTLTIAGGTTGNFPLVFDGAGNLTFSTTPLTGSGSITKNGAGTVTYTFPNTNTGATTINAGTLLYGVDNATMTGAITVNGGTLDIATFSDMVGTVTLGTLDLASGTITGTTGVLSSSTWTVYQGTISAIIAGVAGTLTKSTTGTVTLTKANLYTGATTVSLGILKIQNNTALGTIDGITTVTAGATLEIDGSGLSVPEYITFSGTGHFYSGAIRNRTGNNTLTGLLTLGTAALIEADSSTTLTIDSKGLSAANIGLLIGGTGDIVFTSTAPIYGSGATLTKNDTGTLTLQAFNNFTGATNLNRGAIVLSGSGAIANSAITIGSNATLTLDNSTTVALNRISDSAALTMNGGTLNFIGNASSTALETAGALTPSTGHNVITVTPGAGGPTTMIFSSFARTAGATALFRGTSLGSNPAANISTIMFTTAPTLSGGGGAFNSATLDIIKGAYGDSSLSGTGSDMVTYNKGNTNGLRLLNGAGFSGEYSSTLTTNTNVKLTADTAASTVTINSFILDGFNITNPGSAATITIGSLAGNILIDSANNIAGANTTLGITTNELPILATANATISAIIGTAVAGSLTLSGSGNVTLSAASAYTGTTYINNVTLTHGASNVLSTGGVTVVGGTYDIGNFSESIGAVILQNGTITGGSGTLTSTASYSFREGTVSAIIAGSVAVTRIATSAAADSIVTMTRDNTYTGVTTITSGILKLGGAGGATNTPLGTTAGGTTIANIAALDLNGYTLGTAEAITSVSGLGYGLGSTVANGNSNMGAIMNSSGSAASYSGAITLAAAARINADYGVLTISGGISGATIGLTIGGFSNSTFSGIIGTTSGTLTKDGIGVLTLSNSNTYTGATTISAGTVKLGATGDATNTPLGTTGAGTTVSLGARLDLNGFTLGAAEGLTLNGTGYGTGDFASGALINSSGSSVSYSGATVLGSAATIKADSGQITLSGGNSGAFGLTLGGTGTGILSGTIASSAATVTKIDTGTWTLSGASNAYTGTTSVNLGTLKIGAAGVTTSPLGTTVATTVYSGAALDLAGFALGTAEALTINGRGINDGGALMNSGGAVTFSGAITQATDSRIANSGSGLLTISGGVTGAFALYASGSANITFSTAALGMGTGTLTKQGSGTATITFAGTYTGATRVDAGTLAEGVASSLSSGSVEVKGGTFDMATFSDTVGAVTLVGGSITGSTGVLTGTAYTFEGGTISAILAGVVAVTKNTNNTVTLSGVNTISSTMTINAGTVTISGSGSDVSVTAITVNLGGTLTLDNSTTAVASRLLDTIVITMNGGNLNFLGNSAALSSETIGQLAFASGHNTVTVTPGAGGSTTLTVANNPGFNRTAGATVLFRGTSLGSTPAANVSTLMFTTAPALTGGGGASSTTTISVIKGAFGDSSLSGTGSDMVTYNVGNTNGLRLLNGAGFSGEYATNLATTNANVKLTADAAASTVTTNSIILNGFSVTNPGSAQTITLSTTGNILANSATSIAGANTTLGISTSELCVLATANATISAVVGTATTGSLTLSGSGNVTLSAANAYTSTTTVNNATFTYGASNVISSGGLTIVGGTVNLNGNSDTVGTISINAGTIATAAGTLTGNGTFSTVANNNVASIITGNLGLGANATFTINDGLMDNDAVITAVISGAFTFGKAGSGVLELSGSNTYSGAGTISAGTLRLGAAGGATNTPLGTTAAGTTVASGFSLDLNGYTLGTSEALTISGTGIGTRGALMNTSSSAVTYSGLITLGAAASIYADYGTITLSNTGSMTGTGFALTLRGAGNGSLATQVNTSTAGSLVKNDLGTWTISGDSNYTGVTTITAGTLKLGAAGGATNNPLGTIGGATTVASGAIFDLNGFTAGTAEPITINGTGIASIGAFINSSNNTISYSGAITLGAASRVANYGSGVTTFSGAISGTTLALTFVTVGGITQSSASVWSGTTGTIIKEGSGTLILAGQNTGAGAITVSTGVLQLGASGGATNTPLGTNAGGVTVALGAVLDLSTFSLGGASTYETLNLSGTGIKEGGAITSSASGANNFGAMTVTANSTVKNSGSGLITFTGIVTIANTINLGIGGTGPTTISGVFGATATTATINKWDSGIFTISAASITTGLVRINGGTLKYGVADALSTPAVTVAGGTLDLVGFNETNIGAVTLIDGSLVNTGGAATITSTATYTVEKGTISAVLGSAVAAGIAKNTGGRVTLSGNNTFTSTSIALNAGYLNLQNSNALGAAGTALLTTISGGATMELQNNITLPSTKTITANGTGMEGNGAIRNVSDTNVLSANVTLGTTNVGIHSDSGSLIVPTISGNTFSVIFGGAGNTTVTGAIGTTSGAVLKSGAGNVTLSGTNTYTGTTTALAGTIIANTTSSLGDGSATNTFIFRGGTLQATGTITSPVNRAFTLASNAIFDTNGNGISIAGTLGAAGSLTKTGAGTLTVTGATTLEGNLTISAGTFAPTAVTISGNTTQSIDGFNPSGTLSMTKAGGTATFTSAMSGSALTINGTGGTLNLGTSLTHTFSGDVTLTAGTLNGGSSTLSLSNTSATVWNGTGTVFTGGTGTVNFSGGNQTLAATATTFNNLTLSGGGTKTFSSATVINGDFTNSGGTPTYATYNPADKSTHITLSGGDLIVSNNDGGAFDYQVRATQGKSSGKWYWENTFVRQNPTYEFYVIGGVSAAAETIEGYTGHTDGASTTTDGDTYVSSVYTPTGWGAWTDGQVAGFALDMDAGTLKVYRNNTLLGTIASGLSGTYYPSTGTYQGIGTTTTNFGATAFVYTPPTGHIGVSTGGSAVAIATGNNTLTLGGNFTNASTALDAGSSNIVVAGTSTQSVAGFTTTGTVSMTKTTGTATLQGAVNAGALTINGVGGTLNLGAGLAHTITGVTTVTNGALDGGSSNLTTASFSSSNSNTRTLALGSGTWSLTGTGTVWDMATSTGATITPGSSTIKLTNASASSKTFAGGGKTYNNFWFAPGAGSGSLTISGNNTFNNFKDDGTAAHSILFTTGSTQSFSSWSVVGNPGQLISIDSTTTGTHALQIVGSGSVSSDYLSIQHSVATPSGRWFAGTHSTNNQGVSSPGSGWFFFAESLYRYGGGGAGGESQNGGGGPTGGGGAGGGAPTTATGLVVQSGGVIQSVTMTYGGSGYTVAPIVTFCLAGTGGIGTAVLTADAVTSVTINNGGTGYNATSIVLFGSACPTTGGGGGGGGDSE